MSLNEEYNRLPHFGPLDIKSHEGFLNKSKRKFELDFKTSDVPAVPIDNLELQYIVGKGAFSFVELVKRKSDGQWFAVKVSEKEQLVKLRAVKNTLNEKRILQSLDYPFTIRIGGFSHDPYYIYFLMPYVAGGDIFTHLQKKGHFNEELTRFYAAQMVLALEYLNCICVVHRDIKPENILVDQHGFLKLADFGFSKIVGTRTFTFCGTSPFIAPEIIQGQGYGRSVDLWSLGILIFEMAAGTPPWVSRNNVKLFLKILYDQLKFPLNFSSTMQDLLRKLLQRDVTRRFGHTWMGAAAVKEHVWFKKVDWWKMLNRTTNPPFVPLNTGYGDVSNFPDATKSSVSKMAKAHAPFDSVDASTFADEFKDF